MERLFIEEIPRHQDQSVKVTGWVHTRRDHGRIIFIDVRDRSGIVQTVFQPDADRAMYEAAKKLRSEWVIEIEGTVKARPSAMQNPALPTGSIELRAEKLTILNPSETPPFDLTLSENNIGLLAEETRLKYRYLDLRRPDMFRRLAFRGRVIHYMRNFLYERGFIEVETPLLTKSTPEGARDFLVPSRLHQGNFYALPQSPQQYKQLLMVAGFERYFQIARCFRDEDTRGDRQPEFTQLDIEMSFIAQEDILRLLEELLSKVTEELTDCHLTVKPFPRLSFQECMKKYGTDKPDLRNNKNDPKEISFAWIVDWPLFEWNAGEKRYDAMHHIFTAPRAEDIPLLETDPLAARSEQYDLVANGYEVAGGSVRIHQRGIQEKIFSLVGISPEEARRKFGHLLTAFEYGAPPHGGIASGLERLLMVLAGAPNIREVMAFPKTGDGRDPLMESPSGVADVQLRELGIQLRKTREA